MEKNNELRLLRARSMASVVSDGYQLYMSLFRQLFRSSWIVAIFYALAFALMLGNYVNNLIPMEVTLKVFGHGALVANPETTSNVVYIAATTLLYILAATLLGAQAIHMFREHSATGDISRPQHWYGRLCLNSFLRLLAVVLWMMVIGVIVGVAFSGIMVMMGLIGIKGVTGIVFLALVTIIILALLVPLAYTIMRALLASKKVAVSPPLKGYALGLRHWGLLFTTLFVVSLFTYLLTLVCELPAVIIAVANANAYAGVAMGDPIGMPESMVPMTYCVFTVAGFIQAYVHLSSLFPLYYAYGSIEQQRIERNEMKIDIKDK